MKSPITHSISHFYWQGEENRKICARYPCPNTGGVAKIVPGPDWHASCLEDRLARIMPARLARPGTDLVRARTVPERPCQKIYQHFTENACILLAIAYNRLCWLGNPAQPASLKRLQNG